MKCNYRDGAIPPKADISNTIKTCYCLVISTVLFCNVKTSTEVSMNALHSLSHKFIERAN